MLMLNVFVLLSVVNVWEIINVLECLCFGSWLLCVRFIIVGGMSNVYNLDEVCVFVKDLMFFDFRVYDDCIYCVVIVGIMVVD